MRFGTNITVDGFPVVINVPRGSSAWRKANAVFCPLGPAPMQAWLLMLRGDVASLDVNAAHTITWSEVSADDADPPVETTTGLVFPGLYIVNAERVLHGGPDDANALYLVEFADGRLLAAKNSDSGIIQANIRTHANANDYMLGTEGETWETLTQKLWDRCGTLGTYAGLPAALPLDGVPQNTWLNGLNSYRSLTAVLEQLDCALRRVPGSASMNIVQLGADQTLPDGWLKWDGQPFTSNVANAAANLTIYHYYHFSAYGQERDAEYKNNWAYNDPAGPTAMPTGIAGASGTQPLWDDLPRILDEVNTVSNAAAVTTRDNNRVARYATRWNVTNRHKIYAGLVDITPGGQIRAVLWRNWDDGDENELGGTVTEWITCPQLITGLKQSGSGEPAWFDSQLVAPEREPYAAPDISRHSFPNFPRLPNMVQVWQPGGSVAIGDEISRDYVNSFGYSFFSGRVRRWVSNQLNGTTGDFALDDCWILFTDDINNVGGNVKALHGEIYGPARLSGVSSCSVPKANGDYDSSAALQRPVYVVRRGTPDSVVEMVTLSDKNGSGELQLGLLGNGVFVGRIITSKFNGDGLMSKHNFCAIHFADFGLDAEVANLKIIAENGRIYGPAKYVGEADVESYGLVDDSSEPITTLSVYRCSVGVQEFNAVSSSGYSKGVVGTFQLCTQLGTPLNIFIDAICLYNAYTVGADPLNPNLARINRTYNGTMANQIEC